MDHGFISTLAFHVHHVGYKWQVGEEFGGSSLHFHGPQSKVFSYALWFMFHFFHDTLFFLQMRTLTGAYESLEESFPPHNLPPSGGPSVFFKFIYLFAA